MLKHTLTRLALGVAASCAVAFAAVPTALHGQAAPTPGSCAALQSLALPQGTVTSAAVIEAGATLPTAAQDSDAPAPRAQTAPRTFCRVAATLKPSSDSDIKIEVWMPASDWNGKFQAVGNGAFNGSIGYPAMRTALTRGYATASTDTGHTGNNASFALGHPEKLTDFAWRAVHEMTLAAKAIVKAHYSSAPSKAYWNGCSAGGRQGMMEAQRFPQDFDGIIAGAPGLDWTGRAAQAVHIAQAIQRDPTSRLTSAKTALLHAKVVDACDALDGLKDGLLSDPRQCKFDPVVLQCKGADDGSCLTAGQVSVARMIYAHRENPKAKRRIAGLFPGSEPGWTEEGWTGSARATGFTQFRFLVFKNPQWDIAQFDFDADIVRSDDGDAGTLNALDTNLKPFFERGGKLISYHGWADPQISPGNTVDYFERVRAASGATAVDRAYRLFMAPGMGHCSGGEGPNTFDMVAALEQWVEQGKAPDRIVASHATRGGSVDRTRPLCPYPQMAVYNGSGSVDEAANFTCRAR